MGFMGQDESRNLFKSAAFANEALPSEFENIGKQMAVKCHGLPLTIVVIGGLLKSKREIEDQDSVAKDVKSFVTNEPNERCSHVLELSYNHLTSCVKTCLLYFRIFSEDFEIPVKHLMRLWMDDGLPNLENDLECEAEMCLQDLIERCVDLVSKKSLDERKIRSCKVHDLIHDLCLREILRGNVFILNDIVFDNTYANHVRPGYQWSSRSVITFPEEIWGLMQLRHLEEIIPSAESFPATLKKLKLERTILWWSNLDIIAEFPNLEQLKSFSIKWCLSNLLPVIIPSAKALPAMLKKLKLYRTDLSWLYLNIIVQLPNLEVLMLMSSACRGQEWYTNVRSKLDNAQNHFRTPKQLLGDRRKERRGKVVANHSSLLLGNPVLRSYIKILQLL
ncbi:hypothetical protein CQW23_06298 [Capsicum baccatum]|uniref:Disease resistance protein winged helix domain-containing protein n=1 Tax=Capsicum baccatum TaxID=33114 RepID=A0A2G2X2W7_CAPBA|nr:hypothetical protein CQW23_06298 [Capsicum baccatum]